MRSLLTTLYLLLRDYRVTCRGVPKNISFDGLKCNPAIRTNANAARWSSAEWLSESYVLYRAETRIGRKKSNSMPLSV